MSIRPFVFDWDGASASRAVFGVVSTGAFAESPLGANAATGPALGCGVTSALGVGDTARVADLMGAFAAFE